MVLKGARGTRGQTGEVCFYTHGEMRDVFPHAFLSLEMRLILSVNTIVARIELMDTYPPDVQLPLCTLPQVLYNAQ